MSKISKFWKNREGYTWLDAAYIILDMSPQPPENPVPLEVQRIIGDIRQTMQKYKPDDFKMIDAGERGLSKVFLAAFAENYGFTDFFKDDPIMPEAMRLLGKEYKQTNDKELISLSEREYLLRTIGSLTLLLIEKTPGSKFGSRERPNKAAIYGAIQQLLSDMNVSDEGQSKTRLNDILREALEIAIESKTKL